MAYELRVRRFAQMGFEVAAGDNHRLAFGMYSKCVSSRLNLPSLRNDPMGFAENLSTIWMLQTFVVGPESWEERKTLKKQWIRGCKEIVDDMHQNDDLMPTIILYFFLLIQTIELVLTDLEASDLFLYYNSYVEETYIKQKEKADKNSTIESKTACYYNAVGQINDGGIRRLEE